MHYLNITIKQKKGSVNEAKEKVNNSSYSFMLFHLLLQLRSHRFTTHSSRLYLAAPTAFIIGLFFWNSFASNTTVIRLFQHIFTDFIKKILLWLFTTKLQKFIYMNSCIHLGTCQFKQSSQILWKNYYKERDYSPDLCKCCTFWSFHLFLVQ